MVAGNQVRDAAAMAVAHGWLWRHDMAWAGAVLTVLVALFVAYIMTPSTAGEPAAGETKPGLCSSGKAEDGNRDKSSASTSCPELSREFVRDMAFLAEHFMMHDLVRTCLRNPTP